MWDSEFRVPNAAVKMGWRREGEAGYVGTNADTARLEARHVGAGDVNNAPARVR